MTWESTRWEALAGKRGGGRWGQEHREQRHRRGNRGRQQRRRSEAIGECRIADLLRELVCDHCGRDYGVYAIGLFCPDCGAPNLRLHFAREVELVRRQVELANSQAESSQELAYRLLGNAHEDVLTGFEATLKAVYLHAKNRGSPGGEPAKPVKNDFQNVEFARKRFGEVDFDPFACLEPGELDTLKLNIQKRHIIGHNLGVMDARFAEHDDEARLGETVHLVGEDILAFADLGQRIIADLDTWLVGLPAPMPLSESATAVMESSENSGNEVAIASPNASKPDLSPLALRVGKWIAKHSEDGTDTSFVELDSMLSAFADVTSAELEEAVAELEMDGFVSTMPTGSTLPYIRPTIDLFNSFDPLILGFDPTLDAAELVKLVLAEGESIAVSILHEKSGGPRTPHALGAWH